MKVVGFIDDDANLWGRRIKGKTIYNLNQVFLLKEKIDQVIIAIPSCSKQRIKEIIKLRLFFFNLTFFSCNIKKSIEETCNFFLLFFI